MSSLLSFKYPQLVEAGCDEAGRGCLAGPVVAAAVILPKGYKNDLLDDSKKLSEKKRLSLKEQIEADALSYAVSFVSAPEIDQLNILKASFVAMHRAIDQLNVRPEILLIDGNRFIPYEDVKHECIVKGDAKFQSIAAASILAKTYRDEYMEKIANDYPYYDWKSNKGYPTSKHRDGIRKHGASEYHRQTFTLLPADQLSLFD